MTKKAKREKQVARMTATFTIDTSDAEHFLQWLSSCPIAESFNLEHIKAVQEIAQRLVKVKVEVL